MSSGHRHEPTTRNIQELGISSSIPLTEYSPFRERIPNCAVAYANGNKLRVRTDQEQQLWSECSRLLANCIIYYNACILSELLERAERRQDYQRGRRDQASEPGKLEACEPLRGLQLPGYRRWGRHPGIGQSLGGSQR
jgi:hypothetical protein